MKIDVFLVQSGSASIILTNFILNNAQLVSINSLYSKQIIHLSRLSKEVLNAKYYSHK